MKLLISKKRKAIISLTSLIDVILLLLIFFMLTSNFVDQPGMKLDLPETKSAGKNPNTEPEVRVFNDGRILLENRVVILSELEYLFKELAKEGKTGIILKADRNVYHGTIVKIMDYAKGSGLEKIIIASKSEE